MIRDIHFTFTCPEPISLVVYKNRWEFPGYYIFYKIATSLITRTVMILHLKSANFKLQCPKGNK